MPGSRGHLTSASPTPTKVSRRASDLGGSVTAPGARQFVRGFRWRSSCWSPGVGLGFADGGSSTACRSRLLLKRMRPIAVSEIGVVLLILVDPVVVCSPAGVARGVGDDGQECHAEIADLRDQAMELGLVRHDPAQGGRAVGFLGEGEADEPGGPMWVEVAQYAELVADGCSVALGGVGMVRTSQMPMLGGGTVGSPRGGGVRRLCSRGNDRNLLRGLVTGRHHMW